MGGFEGDQSASPAALETHHRNVPDELVLHSHTYIFISVKCLGFSKLMVLWHLVIGFLVSARTVLTIYETI